jgi:hypothetical protein
MIAKILIIPSSLKRVINVPLQAMDDPPIPYPYILM